MQAHENHRGARHRILILIYIAWLTLSLAPAMVAPPERTFQRGQPEMQQSMDNMVTRQTIIQKRMIRSPKDGQDDPEEINSKIAHLLAEAEKVLKAFPDTKERNWMETFIEKMGVIAKMLDETAQRKYQAKDSNSVKGAPVRDGLPKQPQRPAPSAVPAIPFQKPIGKMSKDEMASPDVKKAVKNDVHSESRVVTKSVQLQPTLSSDIEEAENDELVRELKSLHEEKAHQTPSESPKMTSEASMMTTTPSPAYSSPSPSSASPSPSSKRNYVASLKEESEKAKLKAKLIEEIEEFHRLGGIMPKEVIDVLYADNHKITDAVLNRNINMDEEIKFTESGMKDRQGMIRLNDVNNEDKEISMGNMKNLPPYAAQQFQYMKFNHTFPNRHPNFIQGFPRPNGQYYPNIPPRAQFYQGNPQNPYNQGKYQDLAMYHQPGRVPDALRQRMARPYNFYNGRLPPYNYFMRHNYNPYPYVHNWNPQNSSTYLPQMMPPYAANQAKVDTQLSDEMKRELRDGKIIVLSNSVVRSNFEADKKENVTQSTTGKPESEQMEKKNETTTEN